MLGFRALGFGFGSGSLKGSYGCHAYSDKMVWEWGKGFRCIFFCWGGGEGGLGLRCMVDVEVLSLGGPHPPFKMCTPRFIMLKKQLRWGF